jgi:hypothetical protein
MGCGASKDDIAAFKAMRERCDQLELDRAELEQNVVTLEKHLVNNEVKSKEQLNLYRFKIEVMSNMLSVEEKKLGSTVKRLETLKLAMLTQVYLLILLAHSNDIMTVVFTYIIFEIC